METYAKHLRDKRVEYGRTLTHMYQGLPNIRNNMMVRVFKQECDGIVMADDNVIGMWDIGTRTPQSYYDLDTFLAVMVGTGNAAVEMGAGIFGFHQSGRPQERSMLKHFELRSCTSS